MQASMTPSHMACSVRVSIRSGHAAAAGDVVEIFEDDAAVEYRLAVVGDQRRNFSERIVAPQGVGGVHRIGLDHLDAVRQPEVGDRHADLAAEGRRWGNAKQHGRPPKL
jgi:hypothetical protein